MPGMKVREFLAIPNETSTPQVAVDIRGKWNAIDSIHPVDCTVPKCKEDWRLFEQIQLIASGLLQ